LGWTIKSRDAAASSSQEEAKTIELFNRNGAKDGAKEKTHNFFWQ